MINWKTLHVGDKLTFHVTEFDGTTTIPGFVVTETCDDYAVAKSADMTMLVDDDTQHMFRREMTKSW